MLQKTLADYYTIGNRSRPFYTPSSEPEYCFSSVKEAREELHHMKKEFPKAGFCRVWRVQTKTSSTPIR